MMTDIQKMTSQDFQPYLGQSFNIALTEGSCALELLEASTLGTGARDGGAFSLLWQGPTTPALQQGTYEMTHEKLGAMALFLVPVAQKDAGFQYEAVFT